MLLRFALLVGGTHKARVIAILLLLHFGLAALNHYIEIGEIESDRQSLARDWHHGSGGLLVVSFLTSVAIGMALELGQLLLAHVCCKCCPCHDDDAITDAPAGVVVAQPAA